MYTFFLTRKWWACKHRARMGCLWDDIISMTVLYRFVSTQSSSRCDSATGLHRPSTTLKAALTCAASYKQMPNSSTTLQLSMRCMNIVAGFFAIARAPSSASASVLGRGRRTSAGGLFFSEVELDVRLRISCTACPCQAPLICLPPSSHRAA